MSEQNQEFLSGDTKQTIENFQLKDAEFQTALSKFFEDHADDLAALDKLREERNAALDSARRDLRADAERAPYLKVKAINVGPFKAQKKWSSWFVVDMFVSLVKSKGLFDSAVAEGVISQKTEIDGKRAEEWLRKNSLSDQFKPAEDGKELACAVYGPKEVPPFGAELKK